MYTIHVCVCVCAMYVCVKAFCTLEKDENIVDKISHVLLVSPPVCDV